MAAKKKYYNKKLQEKRIKILKNIIEEEIDLFLSEQDDGDSYDSMGVGGGATYSPGYGFGGGYGYGGGGGGDGKGVLFPWRRGSSASALTGDIVPKVGTILARGASTLATQAISGLKKAVLGTISALLPFNDPRATKRLLDGITNWEQRQVGAIDQHFAPGMKMIEEDWSHFKDDFWGIGFMASPANAIAAAYRAPMPEVKSSEDPVPSVYNDPKLVEKLRPVFLPRGSGQNQTLVSCVFHNLTQSGQDRPHSTLVA